MRIVVVALLSCMTVIGVAQKNRSVVSDCITLSGLLAKDYNQIQDLETRRTAIVNDRKTVISIFKSYLPPASASAMFTRSSADIYRSVQDSILKSKIAVNTAKVELENTPTTNATLYATKHAAYLNALNSNNTIIYDKEYRLFQTEFDALIATITRSYNPYLNDVLVLFRQKYSSIHLKGPDNFATGFQIASFQKSIAGSGNAALNFTNAMDGLSRFIIKRLKEELATQVFQRIQTQISSSNYDELRIILPKTTNYLLTITPDQYVSLPNLLKEKINQDLEDLLENIPNVISLPRVSAMVASRPELAFVFQGMTIIKELRQCNNPYEIFYIIENSPLIATWSASTVPIQVDISNAIRFSGLLLRAISIQEGTQTSLVKWADWQNAAKDVNFYKTFLGFVMQQNSTYYNISFSGTTLNSQLIAYHTTLGTALPSNVMIAAIESLLAKSEAYLATVSELQRLRRQGGKIEADTLVTMLNTAVDIVDETAKMVSTVYQQMTGSVMANFNSNFNDYLVHARAAVTMYGYLSKKTYFEASSEALAYLINTSTNPVIAQRRQDMLKLLEFLISIRNSNDPDQFAEAIEKFALPAGSSSIKRKSSFNLAINTYPGLFLSGERLTNVATNKKDTLWAFNSAFTVPIGLSANFGLRERGVFTVFASIIDIGAISSIRFKENESELPEISFKNVLAPGIHLMYGFPNSPFTIGVGVQSGPSLRKILINSTGTPEKVETSSIRAGITLSFDIPIFNIYTRAR
jgi:hypothetical protein